MTIQETFQDPAPLARVKDWEARRYPAAHDWSPATSAERRRIHITGAPRSGTTLLHVLFLACFDIDGGVKEELRLRRPAPRDRWIVCTKCPDEVGFTAAMLSLDPRLHAVYVARDPRDVIASEHGGWPGRYFTNLRVWRRSARAARRARGKARFHTVDYHRLVTEPDVVQAELMAAMPFLRRTHPFSRYHEVVRDPSAEWAPAMHAIRPVTANSLGAWRFRPERIKGQIARHGDLAADLIAHGYERDRHWMSALRSVKTDLTASVHPETLGLRRALRDRLPRIRDAALYLLRNAIPMGAR